MERREWGRYHGFLPPLQGTPAQRTASRRTASSFMVLTTRSSITILPSIMVVRTSPGQGFFRTAGARSIRRGSPSTTMCSRSWKSTALNLGLIRPVANPPDEIFRECNLFHKISSASPIWPRPAPGSVQQLGRIIVGRARRQFAGTAYGIPQDGFLVWRISSALLRKGKRRTSFWWT